METQTMAVLLKNLLARAPKVEDLEAITELIAASDIVEYGKADSTMGDVASDWHQPGFDLATDAWVIVTNKGQPVGFACVWHRNHEEIFTFVCVHPEYRSRGIGTLLLRLVEERARQYVRIARPGTRVTLCSSVSSLNEQAMRLYQREGYTPLRKIWRVAIGTNDSSEKSSRRTTFKADLDVHSQYLGDASPLYELDALYIIREFEIYEKELRGGTEPPVRLEDELKVLMVV
jgi:ribosomal protein S18 acetylase RimI-like enzyme